ncbi:MAG: biotin/lipoyl-binding protein, partial [Myxococcales bacterium]|nr:biotin/lipoyl-binding protein [Myxococcales bacterium]
MIGCARGGEPTAPAEVGAPRLRVRVAKVQQRTVSGKRTFPGVLQPWEQATLGARIAGHLATIRVDRGSKIKKGDVLATISIPGLSEAQLHAEAQLKSAESDLSLARDMESRATKVAAANPEAIAAAEVAALSGKAHAATARADGARAELARARAQLEDATLRAPFDG